MAMAYGSISHWLSGALATAVIVCPVAAQAAELENWSFDETNHQLEFSLPESVIPQFFMLAEPARIVLDIPNTQIGSIATDQNFAGAVERIRVSQFDASTVRIVMDLTPGITLDPQQADIQFDNLAGQRQWRFRPLISDAAIAVARDQNLTASAPVLPSIAPPIANATEETTEETTETTPAANPITADPGLPSPAATQPEPSNADLSTSPVAIPVIPNDAALIPEAGEGPISFSAASLQGPAPTSPLTNTLPTDIYDTPETDTVVSVPAITATRPSPAQPPSSAASATVTAPATVSVPPISISAPRDRTSGEVAVPAMVAPTLEADVGRMNSGQPVPDQPSATAPSVAAIDTDLPNLATGSSVPVETAPAQAIPIPTSPAVTPAAIEATTTAIAAPNTPSPGTASTGRDSSSRAATSTPEIIAPTTPAPAFIETMPTSITEPPSSEGIASDTELPLAPVAALNPAPFNPDQLNLGQPSSGQQGTEEPMPTGEVVPQTVATEIEVVQLPGQTQTTIESRWPAPIQFGQPLPEDF